tara:strand:+ start:15410 stop:15868 length:459 start_codon:yes stop_codon:yes gene_type:complete
MVATTRRKKTVKKKPRKVKNPTVVSNIFEVEAPASPDMGKDVISFKWDLYEKNFTMRIVENNNMDAFTWIAGITNAYDQARLHTHLASHDMVYVTLFNQNNDKVALYRFGKLTLNAHSTELNKECTSGSCGRLVHTVLVTFERCEKDKDNEE